MNVLIIEDELPAANRLKRLLKEIRPDANIVGELDTVRDAVAYLKDKEQPDLMLLDIHLADGSSFDIFEEVEVKVPVIFITAYDEYAIQGFKVNSIDYLLKPVKAAELSKALDKLDTLRSSTGSPDVSAIDYQALAKAVVDLQNAQSESQRIVLRFGGKLKAIDLNDVAYFYTEAKTTLMRTFEGKNYGIDYTLDQIEEMVDTRRFFRIHRSIIVNYGAIKEMYTYTKARVKLELNPPATFDAITSSERSAAFKEWLKGF
ncbi:MAG: LytR/AlgR family response regulator transcription factor [Bacteroidia bacterium]